MLGEDEGVRERSVQIPVDGQVLQGSLALPPGPRGIVIFAHGSGSGRLSPRNRFVAEVLQRNDLGTLLLDLLLEEEERADETTGQFRFDIPLLGARMLAATDWVMFQPETRALRIGYFGASTGAAAALVAAAHRPTVVGAVVSRGGRPDLAGKALASVWAPTLLLVGGSDFGVIELNEQALQTLISPQKDLQLIPGATHLFEEPGALEDVSSRAAAWYRQHLIP